MKFCCRTFPSKEDNGWIDFYCDRTGKAILAYVVKWREYFIVHTPEICYDIYYCPWCGAKLPTSLCDEWFEILEKEYGIEDPRDSERSKVPAEFWTEEWWKKRGL